MSFSVLITEPKVGQEFKNIEFIIEHLKQLNHSESYGLVVSNSAVMGVEISAYAQLYDFEHRQESAIKRIQSQLQDKQWVICSVWNVQKGVYTPVFIQSGNISFGNRFVVPTPSGEKTIGIFTDIQFNQSDLVSEKLDIAVLLEEFSFQTYFPSLPERITLSDRESLTEQILRNVLLLFNNKHFIPILNVPIINQCNGTLFDGSLGIVDNGKCVFSHYNSKNALVTIRLENIHSPHPISKRSSAMIEHVLNILCRSIKMYLEDTKLEKIVVALSGGIDSALVASLAVKAIGAKNVLGILMPGPYSSDHSVQDAVQLCENLGISYKIHSITSTFDEYIKILGENIQSSLSIENLQARIRGTILMAYSNEQNAFTLNTCNKSEDLIGYATLYGDAVGAFAPIGDLYKLEVYELAEYFNAREYKEVIPLSILAKEPSAELRENQKDTDTLPPYHILDQFLFCYLEAKQNPYKIGEKLKLSKAEVEGLLKKLFYSEYKRQQSPVVFKLGNQNNLIYSNLLSQTQPWA